MILIPYTITQDNSAYIDLVYRASPRSMSFKVSGLLISDFLTAIVMQSCASNNGSLSKDALPPRNFKCQFDSRYFTPIYKVKTGSVKKNVKLLFPVVHFFKARLAYLKIAFHFVSETCSPLKSEILKESFRCPSQILIT